MSDGFSASPLDQLLTESRAKLSAAAAPSGRGSPVMNSSEPATPDAALVSAFEGAADQYGVPVDALLAIAQRDSNFDPLSRSRGIGPRSRGIIKISDDDLNRSGINPYRPEQAIGLAAQKLRGFLDKGMSIEDAIKAQAFGANKDTWGPEAQQYLDDVMGRAGRLADALYPQPPAPAPAAPEAPKSDGTWYGDLARAADRGVGTVMNVPFEIAAAMGSETAEKLAAPVRAYNKASQERDSAGLQVSREALAKVGGRIARLKEAAGREGLTGWLETVADNPMAAIRDFGESAATVATDPRLFSTTVIESAPSMAAVGAGGALGGAAGIFLSSTGMSASSIAEKINEDVANMKGSDLRRLAPQAKTLEEARRTVKQSAFLTVETLATAATAGALDLVGKGAEKMIAGGLRETGGILRTALKGAATEAAQETGQSALEAGGAARAQDAYQPERDNWSGVIRDAAVGAVAGAGMGAGTGAIGGFRGRNSNPNPPVEPGPATQADGEAGAARASPASPAPSAPVEPAAGPVPPPPSAPVPEPRAAAPAGPLARALEAGAPHLRDISKPAGGAVVVTDEGGQRAGHIVGQDADGIMFQDVDGVLELIAPEDIASGIVKVTAPDEAPALAASAASAPIAAESAEPGQGSVAPEDTTGLVGLGSGLAGAISGSFYGGWFDLLARKEGASSAFRAERLYPDTRRAFDAGEIKSPADLKAFLERAEEGKAQKPPAQPGMKQFAPETGTLGVPRAEMPQVESQHHGALVNHLNAKGIAHETTEVDAGALKPTQAEYDPAKVERAKEEGNGDRSVIVSNDGHIIDGHHQAVAAAEKGEPVKAIVLDAPVEEALAAVKDAPMSKTEGGAPHAAETKAGRETEKQLPDMSEPELRERLKYVAGQAKANGGWNRRLMDLRKAVEAEIGKRQRGAAPVQGGAGALDEKPATEPAAGKWFGSREKASAFLDKSKLADTHDVVQAGRVKWEVRPKEVDEAGAWWRRSRNADRVPVLIAAGLSERMAGTAWDDIASGYRKKIAAARELPSGAVAPVPQAASAPASTAEHPGLVIKSLQTGKETVIKPAEAPKYDPVGDMVKATKPEQKAEPAFDSRKWDATVAELRAAIDDKRMHPAAQGKYVLKAWAGRLSAEDHAKLVKWGVYDFPRVMADSMEPDRVLAAQIESLNQGRPVYLDEGDYSSVLEGVKKKLLGEKPEPKAEEAKFSVSPAKSAAWQKHLERLRAGNASHVEYTVVDNSPVLAAVFGSKGRAILNTRRYSKIVQDHPDIPSAVWNFLPQLLANPRFAFSRRDDSGTVVLVGKTPSGANVVVGIRTDGQILTVTPWDNADGESSEARVARAVSSALGRPGTVYAISKDALDETVRRTGSNSPASPASRTGGSHRERAAKIITRDDLVNKSSVGAAGGTGDAGAIRDSLLGGQDGAVISRLFDAGRVVIHDDASTLPSGVTAPDGVQGVTMPDGTIHLVAGNLTGEMARGVLLHEMFHAGARPLVGDRAWTELLKRVGTMADRAMEREAAGEASGSDAFWKAALDRARAAGTTDAHMAEEVAAYAIENRERAPAGLREMADNLVGRVKAWVLRTFGAQIGEVTPSQLRALAVAALRSWRDPPAISTDGGTRYSVAAETLTDGKGSVFDRAKRQASDFLTNAMAGKLTPLALVPTRPLFMELASDLPSARKYLRAKEAMDAMRNDLSTEVAPLVEKWGAFALRRRGDNRALADLMHDTTIAQIDPSEPPRLKAGDPRHAEYLDLRKRFGALPKVARDIYVKARDFYEERADQSEREVIANMRRAIDAAAKRADREHAAEMQRISDKGLTGRERAEAIAEADRKRTLAQSRTRRMRNARLKRLREQFESNRLAGPYFPLARFGRFYVTVRDGDGKVVSFSRFESVGESEEFAAQMRRDKANAVEVGLIEEKTRAESFLDPKFVADVDAILDAGHASIAVRDQVWQRYLETLPDLSMRKKRIHRKNRAGYSSDALRAFASSMFHSAHQIARLRYGLELGEHLDEAALEVKGTKDPYRAGAIFDEMKRAHDFTMNPDIKSWSQNVTSAVFLWTMWANISSALVNLDQSWSKGVPVLGFDAETGNAGTRRAAGYMAVALRDYLRGRGFVANSPSLTGDERAAVGKAYESGVIDKTQAHDLAGVADQGVRYNPFWAKLMKLGSAPMHQTERLNREITFLAAYRLARDAGLSHDPAIVKAGDLTWMTHYDNQASSKSRLMRGSTGRAIFALKSFQANVLYRLFRDLHQATRDLPPAERKAAIGRLTATILLSQPMAGLKGFAGISIVMSIAGLFMGAAGDDRDPEEALRKAVLDATGDTLIGQAAGGMLMDGIPGYLTGTSLSGRIGMADLWFRSNSREMNAEQQFVYVLEQLMGAPVGLAHQVWQGAADVGKGNVGRGVERMLPSALRNPVKAARYAVEGVRDRSGDAVLEKVAPQDVIKQMIGFTPAEIADRHERNNFQFNMKTRIQTERAAVTRAAARADRDGNSEAFDKAMDKVDAFNDRHPDYRVDPQSIRRAQRAMETRSERKEFGVDLPKSIAPFIKERTAPSIYSRQE